MPEFDKSKRVVDTELLAVVRDLPCLACLPIYRYDCDADHITTRGAGGGDTADNVWPLCRAHHTERHARGLGHMAGTYPLLKTWLELAGRDDVLSRVSRFPPKK